MMDDDIYQYLGLGLSDEVKAIKENRVKRRISKLHPDFTKHLDKTEEPILKEDPKIDLESLFGSVFEFIKNIPTFIDLHLTKEEKQKFLDRFEVDDIDDLTFYQMQHVVCSLIGNDSDELEDSEEKEDVKLGPRLCSESINKMDREECLSFIHRQLSKETIENWLDLFGAYEIRNLNTDQIKSIIKSFRFDLEKKKSDEEECNELEDSEEQDEKIEKSQAQKEFEESISGFPNLKDIYKGPSSCNYKKWDNSSIESDSERHSIPIKVPLMMKFNFPVGFTEEDFNRLCTELGVTREAYEEEISKDLAKNYSKNFEKVTTFFKDII